MRRRIPISTFEGVYGWAALYSMRANFADVSNIRYFEDRLQHASNVNIPKAAAGAEYAGGQPCPQKLPFSQQVLVRTLLDEVENAPQTNAGSKPIYMGIPKLALEGGRAIQPGSGTQSGQRPNTYIRPEQIPDSRRVHRFPGKRLAAHFPDRGGAGTRHRSPTRVAP